jgi:hypothetical protein
MIMFWFFTPLIHLTDKYWNSPSILLVAFQTGFGSKSHGKVLNLRESFFKQALVVSYTPKETSSSVW